MEAPRARPTLRLLRPPVDRAFEQLYQRHAREVYQYALALLANPADAEDVTQTTFLNAYRAFQRGERPRKPHNWLIAITHNVCRMRWRQAGARPREVALDEAPEPVANEQERPNLDEVLTALANLSFNQRAALVMRELEGRSYQEISDVLGLSVSAVEALLFRARRRLRIHRKGLGVLTTVPVPGSLTSSLGAGGGGVAAGGAAIGADVVLKAAAVVVAGAVTAGLGYKSITTIASSPRALPPSQAAAANHQSGGASAARRSATKVVRAEQAQRRAAPAGRSGRLTTAPPAQPGTSQPPPGSALVVTQPPPPALPNVPPPALPNVPPPAVTVPSPQLGPPPPLPPAPSLPTVPPLPVTVPVPPIPPLLP